MQFNKQTTNPMLVGAIELMKAEKSDAHNKMFFDELRKAELMALALVDPEPEKTPEGKLVLVKGSKVQFPLLKDKNGRQFAAVFTDIQEVEKFKEMQKAANSQVFALTFSDLAAMVLNPGKEGAPNPCLGVVVNPMGSNVIIPKESVAVIQFEALKAAGKIPADAKLKIVPRKPAGSPEGNASGTQTLGNPADKGSEGADRPNPLLK